MSEWVRERESVWMSEWEKKTYFLLRKFKKLFDKIFKKIYLYFITQKKNNNFQILDMYIYIHTHKHIIRRGFVVFSSVYLN